MATVATSDAGKAIMEDATIQIAVYHLFHIRPEKAIALDKALIIDLLKSLKIILNTLVVLGVPGSSRPIEGGGVGHGLISPGIGQQHMQGFCAVGPSPGTARPWPCGLAFLQLGLTRRRVGIVLFLVSGWTGVAAHC